MITFEGQVNFDLNVEKDLAKKLFIQARKGLIEDSKSENPRGSYSFCFNISKIFELNKNLSMQVFLSELKKEFEKNPDLTIENIVYASRPDIKDQFFAEFKKVTQCD